MIRRLAARSCPQRAARAAVVARLRAAAGEQQARMISIREGAGGGVVIATWLVDPEGGELVGTARELAYLDAQGGRPAGFAGTRADRNARLYRGPA